MIIPEVQVTEADKVGNNAYSTLSTIRGRKTIQALPDADVRALTDSQSPEFQQMWDHLGSSTNPRWIAGEAIEELYVRKLIGEREMDAIRLNWGLD